MLLVILGSLAAGVVLGILGLQGVRWARRRAYPRRFPMPFSEADRGSGRRSAWRRRPGPAWATASLLACLLITGAWLGIVAGASFETAEQRLVALGDVLAGGIFLLALVAGILAVIAYINSSHRPRLKTSWEFVWPDGTSSVDEIPEDQGPTARTPPAHLPPGVTDPVPLEPVTLRLGIVNDGDAAATNVTVGVYLEGIFFDPPPAPEQNSPWRISNPSSAGWWQVVWAAGDRVVYQGNVGWTPVIKLSGMWAAPEIPGTAWGSVITLADFLRQPDKQPLHITIARPPRTSDAPAEVLTSSKDPSADA
jgi:hypothetical protein